MAVNFANIPDKANLWMAYDYHTYNGTDILCYSERFPIETRYNLHRSSSTPEKVVKRDDCLLIKETTGNYDYASFYSPYFDDFNQDEATLHMITRASEPRLESSAALIGYYGVVGNTNYCTALQADNTGKFFAYSISSPTPRTDFPEPVYCMDWHVISVSITNQRRRWYVDGVLKIEDNTELSAPYMCIALNAHGYSRDRPYALTWTTNQYFKTLVMYTGEQNADTIALVSSWLAQEFGILQGGGGGDGASLGINAVAQAWCMKANLAEEESIKNQKAAYRQGIIDSPQDPDNPAQEEPENLIPQ